MKSNNTKLICYNTYKCSFLFFMTKSITSWIKSIGIRIFKPGYASHIYTQSNLHNIEEEIIFWQWKFPLHFFFFFINITFLGNSLRKILNLIGCSRKSWNYLCTYTQQWTYFSSKWSCLTVMVDHLIFCQKSVVYDISF